MNPYFTLAFLSILALQIGLWFLVRYSMEKRKLMKETVAPLFISGGRKSWLGRLGEIYDRSPRGREMEKKIKEMNIPCKPSEWILIHVVAYSGIYVLIINLLSMSGLLAVAVAVGVAEIAFWGFYRYRKSQFLKPVEAQLPDVCRLLGNAVRSGQSIQQGLSTVSRVSGAPLNYYFRQMTNELALGMKLEHAFEKLLQQLPSRELRFFLNTVLVQKETGGNLSQAMDQMAQTLKERQIVNKVIVTATSEGRFTTMLLPIFSLFFVVVFSFSFDLKKVLFNPIGFIVIIVFVAGQVMGFLMVRKICRIEV